MVRVTFSFYHISCSFVIFFAMAFVFSEVRIEEIATYLVTFSRVVDVLRRYTLMQNSFAF